MRNEQPLAVLQLTAPAVVGGLESVVLALAVGLRAREHRVILGTILNPGSSAGALGEQASVAGVEVAPLMVNRRAYLQEFKVIAQFLKSCRPDLVHTHGYRADLFGGLAARQAGIPWVATAHGFTGGGTKNRFYEWLQVQSYRRAAGVIAVSRPLERRLTGMGVPAGRIQQIINAWAPKALLDRAAARRQLGIPSEEFVVGWVGRLTAEKGADVFLRALTELGDLQWSASVIGDGPERPALRAQAQALGISDRLRWHGVVPRAYELFPAFDVFVLSSRTEGTPVALLEAVAARVPAVATAVGGVPDMFPGDAVTLVAPESPGEIAAALRTIAAAPSAALARCDSALHALHHRFDQSAWLDAHEALYRRLLSVPKARN